MGAGTIPSNPRTGKDCGCCRLGYAAPAAIREGYVMTRSLCLAVLLAFSFAAAVPGQAQPDEQARPADLADFAEGTYHGDVISDARGSSRSGVTVTVRRVGPNEVEVSSDYARIPVVRIRLIQAMSSVIADGADYVFLIDRERDPDELGLTIDDASLSVRRHRH